jgi:predicted RNase H-like HicB family nuclease
MEFEIVFDREDDGRWIAEVESLPGVMVYGDSQAEAQSKVLALALRVVADQIEAAQSAPDEVRLAVA